MATSNAGSGARERYLQLVRRWRRRALGRLYLLVVLLMPVLVAGEVLARHFWVWFLGGATGGLLALFVCERDNAPARIAKWESGYIGERKTAKELAPLRRRGCAILHDLADRRTSVSSKGNVDHVLVAPWGVFLLDSKLYAGSIRVEGDVVHVQDLDDESEGYAIQHLARGMRGKAARLREDIRDATGEHERIEAVVVFWSPFEARSVTFSGVHYVHGGHLREWIEARRAAGGRRSSCDVDTIVEGIRQARPSESRPRRWVPRLRRA